MATWHSGTGPWPHPLPRESQRLSTDLAPVRTPQSGYEVGARFCPQGWLPACCHRSLLVSPLSVRLQRAHLTHSPQEHERGQLQGRPANAGRVGGRAGQGRQRPWAFTNMTGKLPGSPPWYAQAVAHGPWLRWPLSPLQSARESFLAHCTHAWGGSR